MARTVKVVLTADVSEYERKTGQAENATSRWERAANASTKAVAVGFAAAGAAAGGLVVALAKTGVEYNTLQQTSRAALTTLLGGAAAANAQMDKLDAFARTSPFAKQTFITAQQQLVGFGLSAQKVIPYLDGIQNAVAAIGGDGQTVAQLSNEIAQVVSGGFNGDFFNSLGQQGIDAAKIMGEQLQMSGQQVRSALEAGTLGTTRALDALIMGMEKRFGGAASNVKQTWAGATDRIKAGWRDLGGVIAEPFVGHTGGGAAIDWANKFADVLRAVEAQAGPTMDHIMSKLGGMGGSGLDGFLDDLLGRIESFDPSSLDDGIDTATQLFGDARDVLAQLLPILETVGGTSATMFGAAVKATHPFLQVLEQLLEVFNSLPSGFQQLVAGAAIIALLSGRFLGLFTTIRSGGVAVAGLVNEMRVLYTMANANGVALTRMGAAASVAQGRLSTIGVGGKIAGVATAALIAIPVVNQLGSALDKAMGTAPAAGDDAASAVEQIARSGRVTADVMKSLGVNTDDLGSAIHDVFNPGIAGNISSWATSLNNALGLGDSTLARALEPWAMGADQLSDMRAGSQALDSLDAGLAQLAQNGNADQAAKAFQTLTAIAGQQGVSVDDLKKKFPQYADALRQAEQANKTAAKATQFNADAQALLGAQTGLTTDELNDQASAASAAAANVFAQQSSVLTSWSASAWEGALKQVASAQEAVASAGLSMARQQRDAAEAAVEAAKRVSDAQKDELVAQSELNKAREDAVRNLRELSEAVTDTALDEKSATIALDRAKLSLLDTEGSRHSSTLDQQEATLAVAQAERRLQEAQEARADANAAADDAQRKGIEGSDLVVAAQQKIVDAAAAVAQAQLDAARQSRSAMEQQADAGRSYAQAQQQLADAQAAAYKASLKGTFEETLRNASLFTDGIVELTRRGLDPALIQQLLQAGPQQAAPVIEQLLSDHSGRLIAMANEAKTQFAGMASQVVEMTRLTNLAVNSNTDQMTRDLSTAMQIAQILAHNGGQATSQELATQLGIGVDAVNRIRQEFGLGLSLPVSAPGVDAAAESYDRLRLSILGVQNGYIQFAQTTANPVTPNTKQGFIPGAQQRAGGGEIFGVGGPTDDANLVLASKGEFMVNAQAYTDNRDLVQAINAGGKFQRLANGGVVGYQPQVQRSPLSSTVIAQAPFDGSGVESAVARALAGWRLQMSPTGMVRMVREQNLADGLLGVVGGGR